IHLEDVGGVDVEMVQTTNYPWDGNVSITVNPNTSKKFSMRVRIPNRDISTLYESTPEVSRITSLAVNGRPVKPAIAKGYAVITRTWNKGDTIDLVFPMKVQRVKASEKIEADRGKVALRYGPLVYNIEQVDQDITGALSPAAPLATEWKPDLLGGVIVIKGQFIGGPPMTAIPNFARINREPASPPAAAQGQRQAPRPPTSIVWITES
ncbi:MAG: hypothetical protein H6Q07_3146, partial [Acidobacteria bacterium]|nr:hypothetical protein [Acidobacteriota bacterium]